MWNFGIEACGTLHHFASRASEPMPRLQNGEDILDLLGIDLLRGQDRVDLAMCDVATLLGGADELYGRIGEAGQRAIRDGLAILLLQRPFLGLLGEHLDLASDVSLLGQR
jgi:hypothetical protein